MSEAKTPFFDKHRLFEACCRIEDQDIIEVEVETTDGEEVIRVPIDRQAEARRQATEEFWNDVCWTSGEKDS